MAIDAYRVIFFDLGDTLVSSERSWLPGAKNMLMQLQAIGIRLGLISNTDTLDRNQVLARLPQDFDLGIFESELVLFSSEVHVEKPALGIFYLALRRAGVPSAQCLFCTETLLDTLAAQQAGMHTARLQTLPVSDISELFRTLEKLTTVLA